MFISAVISYSLAYDVVDVMNDDNFTTALEYQIQINIALIWMVENHQLSPKSWLSEGE